MPVKNRYDAWSTDEDEYLRDWYNIKRAVDIGTHLNRTKSAVIGRARRLGLCVSKNPTITRKGKVYRDPSPPPNYF